MKQWSNRYQIVLEYHPLKSYIMTYPTVHPKNIPYINHHKTHFIHYILLYMCITYLLHILVGGLEHFFHNIWGNHPNWLICFEMVETTNQYSCLGIYDPFLFSAQMSRSAWRPFWHFAPCWPGTGSWRRPGRRKLTDVGTSDVLADGWNPWRHRENMGESL